MEKGPLLFRKDSMELITSWKDSLQLLKPKNLSQFLLVSMKAVVDLYRELASFFVDRNNWILIGSVIGLIVLAHIVKIWHLYFFGQFMLNSMRWILIIIACLALRDSVTVKNRDYFISYLMNYWYVIIVALILGITGIEAIPFVSLWYIFFILFAFDTKGGCLSVLSKTRQSFLMLVYNLPVCFALYAVLSVMGIILYRLEAWALGYAVGLVFIMCLYCIFIPIQIALITNFYIKRLHEQPDLYFTQPQQ